MKRIKYLLLTIIILSSCKSKIDSDRKFTNDCVNCLKRNLQFIDTLKTNQEIDSIVYKKFRNHEYTLIHVGLLDYYDKEELFKKSYAKLRYNIEFIDVGDVGSPSYSRYNETMWKLLYSRYKIHQGILYKEYREKYEKFKAENELK